MGVGCPQDESAIRAVQRLNGSLQPAHCKDVSRFKIISSLNRGMKYLFKRLSWSWSMWTWLLVVRRWRNWNVQSKTLFETFNYVDAKLKKYLTHFESRMASRKNRFEIELFTTEKKLLDPRFDCGANWLQITQSTARFIRYSRRIFRF